jgi:chromate reductase
MKIVILSASQGKNLELSHTLKDLALEAGAEVHVVDLVELDLPLYNTKTEEGGVPEKAKELAQILIASDSFIVNAPEYNGSFPPSLNNAISWISRSGDDWRAAFNNKPCLIGTHSGGGGMNVLTAMRMQLSYIGTNVLGRTLLTNFNKPLNLDSAKECIKNLIKLSQA